MSTADPSFSSLMSGTDRKIVRALQLQPRAPFSLLGEVLGLAEQTVARRLRRLQREGLVRVTAGFHPRALGYTDWIVRVRCRPESAQAVAEALARRDDVSWVTIISGGWEVSFNLRAHSDHDARELLVRLLPKTAPVLDVSAAAVLHSFAGGDPADWQGWRDVLTAQQSRRLQQAACATAPQPPGPAEPAHRSPAFPREGDRALIDALVRDGRAEYAALARATGSTVGKVRRRIEALTSSGALYLDVDIAPAATGNLEPVSLWLTVTPRHLDAVGRALAAQPMVPFAAALTGPANIMATLTSSDLDEAYRFITGTLGPLDGITGYEASPLLRRVKQSGAYVVDDRLSTTLTRPAAPATAHANPDARRPAHPRPAAPTNRARTR